MKRLAILAATAALISTSAGAGGFVFSLPNLQYPPASDVTVSKDCLASDAASKLCVMEE